MLRIFAYENTTVEKWATFMLLTRSHWMQCSPYTAQCILINAIKNTIFTCKLGSNAAAVIKNICVSVFPQNWTLTHVHWNMLIKFLYNFIQALQL